MWRKDFATYLFREKNRGQNPQYEGNKEKKRLVHVGGVFANHFRWGKMGKK